jgi:flagellar basal-body rod protein FlgB
MSHDLPIFKVASAMARHAATRHQTVANNIANADTPGYKARDLSPFDAALAASGDSQAAIGRSYEMKVSTLSPNGNSVALDEQMVMASETKIQHETALAIYRKSMELLRMGLGRR